MAELRSRLFEQFNYILLLCQLLFHHFLLLPLLLLLLCQLSLHHFHLLPLIFLLLGALSLLLT